VTTGGVTFSTFGAVAVAWGALVGSCAALTLVLTLALGVLSRVASGASGSGNGVWTGCDSRLMRPSARFLIAR